MPRMETPPSSEKFSGFTDVAASGSEKRTMTWVRPKVAAAEASVGLVTSPVVCTSTCRVFTV